ncbi:MAG: DNRLRE domain-containing protein [Bacteroidetes bacterium]|nr:DNRLRE domain-containing protein [Bacteroidota bacterium]
MIDTSSVRYLDSETDTMNISNENYKKFINNFGALKILVGRYKNYESKALLKFTGIGADYDSAVIISSKLTLKYADYYFKEKTGMTSFNVYRVLDDLNYTTITYDSVNSSNFGSTSLGNYNGVVNDSSSIDITLDNQTVRDWLESAADSTYPNRNYGILLQPEMSSSVIKGFYSFNNTTDLVPFVTVIYSKNNETDTLILNKSDYVTLSDAPVSIIPQDRFMLQNGIAFRNLLRFDLTKLPPNVIINNATLEFTLDNSLSFISAETDKRLVIGTILDSSLKTDSLYTDAFLLDSIKYSVSLNPVFQRWNSGNLPNLGISMKNLFELQNLDNFVFYSPSYADTTKRPRLKITYTPRSQ